MTTTSIQWTDAIWNPVTGCSRVSEGCRHCYAATIAHRFWGERPFEEVRCHPERLDVPLRWKKSRRVFVNSMSDLFHEDVPDEFIDRIFAVIAIAKNHTFQVLTKRPSRMRQYFAGLSERPSRRLYESIRGMFKFNGSTGQIGPEDEIPTRLQLPFPNVWLGVSIEDQQTADERIPILLRTPGAVRWVSAEPLLGPVDLTDLTVGHEQWNALDRREAHDAEPGSPSTVLDWVVVGGESGPKARPCEVAWIRSIVRQCQAATRPIFVKQLGSRPCSDLTDHVVYLTDAKGGEPSEWPADLRVREWPAWT